MSPEVAENYRTRREANQAWEETRPAFKQSFWPSQQPHDARPWVGDLAIPALVFIGENGQQLPDSPDGWRTRLGMDTVEDLTVEVIPNAGHWMMLDDPERVGDALMDFLRRVRCSM